MTAARLIIVVLVLFAPGAALANGYQGARQLIEQAEQQFGAGREAAALELLGKALRAQTTVGRRPRPYGYARYIHFRLAKHHLGKGDRKRAARELEVALKVKDAQEYVDEPYRVPLRDPFIVQSFPELAGLKSIKRPDHQILPNTIYLHDGSGEHLYGVGGTALLRLNRRTGAAQTLHEQPNDSLYRFDASADDRRLVLVYERDRHIYVITPEPYEERRVLRPAFVDHLHLDATARNAIVYSRSGRLGIVVHRTPLEGAAPSVVIHKFDGQILEPSGEHVLYLTFSPQQGRFHPQHSPIYEQIVLRRFAGRGSSQTLYSFARVGFGNTADAVASRSGKRLAIHVNDVSAGKKLLVHEVGSDRIAAHLVAVDLKSAWREKLRVAFSWNEDYLVFLEKTGAGLLVHRFDPATGALAAKGRIPGAARGEIHAFGVTKDNGTVWIHRGDQLLLLGGGKLRSIDLRRFARKPRPEWAGASYYVAEPEQLYVGIEHRASRYFMKVDLEKLLRAAR